MAKIVEEHIVIKLSKLLKETESTNESLVDQGIINQLEEIVQELVPSNVVVEVIKD